MASNATGGIGWFRTTLPRDEIRASEPDVTTALLGSEQELLPNDGVV
jgi:hypothetical protein